MDQLFIIDRFEGDQAVLSGAGQTVLAPRTQLPKASAEGDALIQTPDGRFALVPDAAQARRREAAARLRALLKRGGNA